MEEEAGHRKARELGQVGQVSQEPPPSSFVSYCSGIKNVLRVAELVAILCDDSGDQHDYAAAVSDGDGVEGNTAVSRVAVVGSDDAAAGTVTEALSCIVLEMAALHRLAFFLCGGPCETPGGGVVSV